MFSLRETLPPECDSTTVYLVIHAIMSNSESHEMLSKQIYDMNCGFDLYIKPADDVLFAF